MLATLVLLGPERICAQPANDDCEQATVVSSLPFVDSVDTSAATTQAGDPITTCYAADAGHTVWYRFTGGDEDVVLTVDTIEGSTRPRVSIHEGECGALGPLLGLCGRGAERAAARVPAGTTVLVRVGDSNPGGDGGPAVVRFEEAPDIFVGAATDSFRREVVAAGNGRERFLVAWYSESGLRLRVLTAAGVPIGEEMPVSPDAEFVGACAVTQSDFILVWKSDADLLAQRIGETGDPIGVPVVIDSEVEILPQAPAVACNGAGRYVVVWDAAITAGIFARLFDVDGGAVGPEVVVPSSPSRDHGYAQVGMDAVGNFLVVWPGIDDFPIRRAEGRAFAADGTPRGLEFAIGDPSMQVTNPRVALAPNGAFLLVWEQRDPVSDVKEQVMAQGFDAVDIPSAPAFQVNVDDYYTRKYGQRDPQVVADGDGNFVVSWRSEKGRTVYGGYSSGRDIVARRIGAKGAPIGGQFEANTVNAGSQYDGNVAALPHGGFLVVWSDYYGGPVWGSETSIVARAFGGAAPTLRCSVAARNDCLSPVERGHSRLALQRGNTPEGAKFRWKWSHGEAASEQFGDPTTDTDYMLCLYRDAASDPKLLLEVRVPAGGVCGAKSCWRGLGKPSGTKGYRYKSSKMPAHGVSVLTVKPGVAGKAKLTVRAEGEPLFAGPAGFPAFPLTLPVRMQVQMGTGCIEARYEASGTAKNTTTRFSALDR